MSPFQKIIQTYKKLSNWGKVLVFCIIFIILISIFKREKQEGFQQEHQFLLKEGTSVYDNFYADIYDYLVYSEQKDEYEIGEIVNRTNATVKSVILDVGCGTGHHVGEFAKQNIKSVVGLDISPSMIAKAKENYPESDFKQGDIMNQMIFKPDTFTHILCMYFTIYYIQDKRTFFKNCFQFLKPGGYLIVHLVNRSKFDPILPPGNPLTAVSPQRYAKERITNTKIKFNDFEYNADFNIDLPTNRATFVEQFKNDVNDKVRKHEHTFYMETQEDILTQAKEIGFILDSKIDLVQVAYEYQYLYVLMKPN